MTTFGLDDARECYFAAGEQESDIGPRDDPEWYWRRAAKSWREHCNKALAMLKTASEDAGRCRVELYEVQQEREEAIASLPSSSGRDENRADRELGEVMRHKTGETSSIGVVEVERARRALVQAYAEANTLIEELKTLRGKYDSASYIIDHLEREADYSDDIEKEMREELETLRVALKPLATAEKLQPATNTQVVGRLKWEDVDRAIAALDGDGA